MARYWFRILKRILPNPSTDLALPTDLEPKNDLASAAHPKRLLFDPLQFKSRFNPDTIIT
jgi:hypothetical protein